MATIPDPSAIDWSGIGLWAGGVTTVVVSMGAAAYLAIQKALAVAKATPPPIIHEEKKIITTDSVAMQNLAATLEAANVILTENNILRREEHNDRQLNRDALEANTKEMSRLLATVEEARREIRDLTFELVRANARSP